MEEGRFGMAGRVVPVGAVEYAISRIPETFKDAEGEHWSSIDHEAHTIFISDSTPAEELELVEAEALAEARQDMLLSRLGTTVPMSIIDE